MTGGDLLDPIRDSSFGEQDEESHDLSDPGGVAEEQWGEGGGRRGIRPSGKDRKKASLPAYIHVHYKVTALCRIRAQLFVVCYTHYLP